MRGKTKHNLLIIASHFPPHERPGGVLRVAKLLKYLPKDNWYPAVLTVWKRRPSFPDKLFEEIQDKCRIYMAPSFDLRVPYHFCRKYLSALKGLYTKEKEREFQDDTTKAPLSSGFLVPDHLFIWAWYAFIKALALQLKHGINVVLVTAPSHSGLIVGYLLNIFTGTKLVVDYRDPWTTSSFHIQRKWMWLNNLEDWLEFKILSAASDVIVVNEYFIDDLLTKFPLLAKDKFTVISNGYDMEDFNESEPFRFEKKVLLHSGNFYFGRSPVTFLKAVKRAAEMDKELFTIWEVVFVGSGEEYKELLVELGISDFVRLIGFVNHEDSISYIRGADALLLIPGLGLTTLTGKIFEYIGSLNPIFLLGTKSAASDLLEENEFGIACFDSDISVIAAELIDFLSKSDMYKNVLNIGNERIINFDRKVIALKFSHLLEKNIS